MGPTRRDELESAENKPDELDRYLTDSTDIDGLDGFGDFLLEKCHFPKRKDPIAVRFIPQGKGPTDARKEIPWVV